MPFSAHSLPSFSLISPEAALLTRGEILGVYSYQIDPEKTSCGLTEKRAREYGPACRQAGGMTV